MGPNTAWYLGVAGFLFGVGTLGVLIRRNPLIVLLSLEIMLNGANLALIAFARHLNNGDGQIFALAGDGRRGLGGRRRARPDRRAQPQARSSRRRPAQLPPRLMIYGAWICLLSPLAAAGLITLAGERISRRGAGYLATLSCFVAFGGAVATSSDCSDAKPDSARIVSTAWTWISGGSYRSGFEIMIDPLSVFMMLIVSGVGALIVAYSIGYMDGDNEERRYFAYMALFVFSMLLLVQGGNLLLLLAGWGMVGLSSYLLIGFWHERPSAIAAAKKAFIMNAIGDATMALALFLLIKKAGSVEFGVLGGELQLDGCDPRRARPARRRGREVGAAAAADVATRRDGGPDAGQRPHPRGDDGDCGRLPDRAHALDLRVGSARRTTSPPGSAPARCSSRG